MKKISQVRVLGNSWFSQFPIENGPQVTLEELFCSLQRIVKQQPISSNPLDQWIMENKFLSTLPLEMIYGQNVSSFQHILNAYNSDVNDFFTQDEKFYLWAQKS